MVFAAQRHQAGHFVLGEPDFLAAELGQRQVGNLEVDAVAAVGLQLGHSRALFQS